MGVALAREHGQGLPAAGAGHEEPRPSGGGTGFESRCAANYFFGGTGLPPGRTVGGGKRSLRICSARMAA
jgi:hypothetical protein